MGFALGFLRRKKKAGATEIVGVAITDASNAEPRYLYWLVAKMDETMTRFNPQLQPPSLDCLSETQRNA